MLTYISNTSTIYNVFTVILRRKQSSSKIIKNVLLIVISAAEAVRIVLSVFFIYQKREW